MKKSVFLLSLVCVVVLFLQHPLPVSAQPQIKTMQVKADRPLNDTKLFVQAGDVVLIKAAGEWSVKPKEKIFCGPAGEEGTSAPKGYEVPGAPIGALTAVVAGKRYLVGARARVKFENSGQLFLTANTRSHLKAYLGNKGALTVTLELKKAVSAMINGRYKIQFDEKQLVLTSGKRKKIIDLNQLEKEKIKGDKGQEIHIPAGTAEKLKGLATLIEVEVKKNQVIIRDPQNPKKPPQKGLYNPDRKEFLIHLEGKFNPVGVCFFLYTKNITGRLVEAKSKKSQLEGHVNVTLTLACKGSHSKGAGTVVNLALPFSGNRISK